MRLAYALLSVTIVASGVLFTAEAFALCTNDIDCPGSTCGGQVCKWASATTHTCVAAGTDPKGSDGWCSIDADCKCMGLGATCVGVHCSFTLPADAPSDAGGADATPTDTGAPATDSGTTATDSGTTATDSGTTATDSGTTAPDTGAASDTGSSRDDTGTGRSDDAGDDASSSSDTGEAAAPAADSGGGGCSIVGVGTESGSLGAGATMVALLGLAWRRRRAG